MPKRLPESEEEVTCRLLEEIAKALVDAPEHVRLEILRGPEGRPRGSMLQMPTWAN